MKYKIEFEQTGDGRVKVTTNIYPPHKVADEDHYAGALAIATLRWVMDQRDAQVALMKGLN